MADKIEWKADPRRGEEFLEKRRAEIAGALEEAADIAFAALDEKLAADIEALRKAVGDKKASISRSVEQARTKPVMEIVRKYWNAERETMWQHFVHNMTEGGKA